jgi:pyruvate dehydrogenase E2 component (dihydrolipoamide acetyltransferase)
MATNVILPALGMSQDSGEIVRWLRSEGEQVQQGEPIAEIQTDKATVELEAPATGTLAEIRALAGEEVPVGHVIALILSSGDVAKLPAVSQTGPGASGAAPEPGGRLPNGDNGDNGSRANGLVGRPPAAPARGLLASPKARRLAAERGIDPSRIAGSGPGGALLAADVLARPRPEETDHGSYGRAWQIMAERTTASWTSVPHFFLLREVRAQAFVEWHVRSASQVEVNLTYTDLLIKITALALRRHPRLNTSWVDGRLIPMPEVNVGFAVATPDGLPVPVIAHADEMSLLEIASQRQALVERAQSGRLRPQDLQGGTFTISNLGMYGVDAFTAIINAPQVAILSVGALVERVAPVQGRPEVVPTLVLGLSCDHRAVDGARGAQFLATIVELITDPARIGQQEETRHGR